MEPDCGKSWMLGENLNIPPKAAENYSQSFEEMNTKPSVFCILKYKIYSRLLLVERDRKYNPNRLKQKNHLSAEKYKGRCSFRHNWIQDSVLSLLAPPPTLWLGSLALCSSSKASGSPQASGVLASQLSGKRTSLICGKYFHCG